MDKSNDKSGLVKRKAAWRTRLLRSRAGMGDELRRAAAVKIRERLLSMETVAAAEVVFCFISYASEVDTHPLLHSLLAGGKTLLVPKILGRECMIAVPLHDWRDLAPGQLGILTPASDEEWTGKVDVCITPGLGFTETGKRLGFGRGYYDQWFAGHPSGQRIAVAFECQVVPDLPVDEHDMPVNCIVTERRIISA